MDKHLLRSLYQLYLKHPVVTTDSRRCEAGSIFFALKGERFDGNQYAAETLQKGCTLAVVDDPKVVVAEQFDQHDDLSAFGQHGQYFLVDDVLSALQQLAEYHRQQFAFWQRPVTVIGITGTNGKTTTKELIREVLSQQYSVLATEGNLNNQIGVPLTLLKVRQSHEIAIIEMGANHPDDIAQLCAIVHPDYGLITNVGKAHLLGFGSLEGVVKAKTKLYDSLRRDNGVAFIDCGNQLLVPHAQNLQLITYCTDENREKALFSSEPKVTGRVADDSPMLHAILTIGNTEVDVQTRLIGNYNLINITAAACVGRHLGITREQIKKAIEGYEPSNMRSQLVDKGHGRFLVLDTYNANPTSMMAALDSFSRNPAPHKCLILGAMGELGEESAEEHLNILRYLIGMQMFGNVLLVGKNFEDAFATLSDEELLAWGQHTTVRCYADVEKLKADSETLLRLPGTILIKGSNAQKLWLLEEAL